MAVAINPPPVNWEAVIFCFGCGDLMIANETSGWDCLTCDGTLRFEDDDHWHWRGCNFYQSDGPAVDEWKGEVSDDVSMEYL